MSAEDTAMAGFQVAPAMICPYAAGIPPCKNMEEECSWFNGTRKELFVRKKFFEMKQRGTSYTSTVQFAARALVDPDHYLTNEGELGRGAFGKVMRMKRMDNGTCIAMKTILEGTQSDRTQKTEMSVYLRLPEHPNVVACYAMDDTVSTMPLAYEFCGSGDLKGVVDGKIELTIAEKLELLVGVAAGVGHIHASNFCHHDLKPDNILLKRRPGGGVTAAIGDFGLSQVQGELRRGQGTPGFIPPEATFTVVESSVKQDLFSLGHVMLLVLAKAGIPHDGNIFLSRVVATLEDFAGAQRLHNANNYEINAFTKNMALRHITGASSRDKVLNKNIFPQELTQVPQFLPLIDSALAVSPEERPSLSSLQSSLEALRRQLMSGASVTPNNPAEVLETSAWQALVTGGIDNHRALPVRVVVGQRMGNGDSGGDISDGDDGGDSWSLAMACVEAALGSEGKQLHENGEQRVEEHRWNSNIDGAGSNPRSVAKRCAEAVLDCIDAADSGPRDTPVVTGEDEGDSLSLVMACVEAVLGSGHERVHEYGEQEMKEHIWNGNSDGDGGNPRPVVRGCAEAVLDSADTVYSDSRDVQLVTSDDEGDSLSVVMACVEAVLGSGDGQAHMNGEQEVGKYRRSGHGDGDGASPRSAARRCAEAVLESADTVYSYSRGVQATKDGEGDSWSLDKACVAAVLGSEDGRVHEEGKKHAEGQDRSTGGERDDYDDKAWSIVRGSTEAIFDAVAMETPGPLTPRAEGVGEDSDGDSLSVASYCAQVTLTSAGESSSKPLGLQAAGSDGNDDSWSFAKTCLEACFGPTHEVAFGQLEPEKEGNRIGCVRNAVPCRFPRIPTGVGEVEAQSPPDTGGYWARNKAQP